MTNRI